MMKQAFRSYLASIHPRNIKKLKENNILLWIYLFIGIVNILTALLLEDSPQKWTMSYVFLLFPLFFMGWSDLNSKYLMSKLMFLCPMKKEEREEYIRCVLICKIGGGVVFGFLIYLIWSIDYGFQIWRMVELLFLDASAGIYFYMRFECETKAGQEISWIVYDKSGKRIYPWISNVLGFAIFLAIGAYGLQDVKPEFFLSEKVYPIYVVGVSVMLLVIAILDIIIVKRQFSYAIEKIGDYEKNFKIMQAKKIAHQKYDMFEKKV